MADNKNKIDRIHNELPKHFHTKTNPNWKALVEAVGGSDQKIAELVEEVRKQFFVKTAYRPYIDRLGSNVNVARPRFVGMQDEDYRRYIPVLAYQPKQVKLILDKLLDVFFFKETTTSFTQSVQSEPFLLKDGWELEYSVDQGISERIVFKNEDFTNIAVASANEIAGAINRQALNSFAIVFDDRISKRRFIRLFTNTVGSKGSIQITGGRADMGLQFTGFNSVAGSSVGVEWTISKTGDDVTFKNTAGPSVSLNSVSAGDHVIIDMPGNSGSFLVESVSLSDASFTFRNLFATTGIHTHTGSTAVNFISPLKLVIHGKDSRSVVWEVESGEIIVEMPASPPVVKRSLIGSAHINGLNTLVSNRLSNTSLELNDASDWPVNGGKFVLQELSEIQTHILTPSENIYISKDFKSRFDIASAYSYTSKTGNILSGIIPNLPLVSNIFEVGVVSATRAGYVVTVVTTTPHGFTEDEKVVLYNTAPDTTLNATFSIDSVLSPTSFTYLSIGTTGVNTGGVCRVERIGMSNDGSIAFLTSAQLDTGTLGPYIWDTNASFIISSLTSKIQAEIKAGNIVRSIEISGVNNIPNEELFAIFDFGTEFQEGPVRVLYKPTPNVLQLDPTYVFKNNHTVNSSITVIRRRGAIVMDGSGRERGAYITDPSVAREILQELMRQTKSVGIFIEFLIRYPDQLYNTLDVYRSGSTNLWPTGQQ